MAELFVTDKEKEDKTYLEWPDETIGKAVKALAVKIDDCQGDRAIRYSAPALILASLVSDSNTERMTFELEGLREGDKDLGNWLITIERVSHPAAS